MDPRLNEEARNYIGFVLKNFPPPKTFDVLPMRERTDNVHIAVNEKLMEHFKGKTEERNIKVDDNTEIPITIYTPPNAKNDKIVVYFHGGGWTLSSRRSHQGIVNTMAEASNSIWISVEYRLSPEHKFPIWLDDGVAVTRQVLANKAAFGGDEKTKVGVGGDSAGALIAASVCHTLKNLDFQIIIYGALDFGAQTESRKEFVKPEHILTPPVLSWFTSNALRDENDAKDPRASVLLNETFDGVPPCLFIVAELDPLRDENYEYQKKLEQAGIKTKLVLVKGVIHSFFALPGIFEKSCAQGLEAIKEFLNEI